MTTMSTKNTSLQDFTSSNDTEPPTKEKEDSTDTSPKDNQGDETPFAESLCPCYTEGIEKCRSRLDERLIQYLSIEKIGCGHAIDYLSGEVGATLAESSARGYSSYLRQYVEFLHKNQTTVIKAEFREVKHYFNRLAKLNRAVSTIKSHRSAITNLYKHISIYTDAEANVNWAAIREEINPSSYRTPTPIEREPLKKSEIKALYDAMRSFRNRLMIQVQYFTKLVS